MRKQNKIISLILVVAMLFSMLVILPVGATAAGEAAPFVPTATAEKMTSSVGAPVIAGTAGNLATGVSYANWDDAVLGKWLWKEAGGNQYVSLNTLADKSTANHFLSLNPSTPSDANKLSFTKSESTLSGSGYYVIEFDYATETDFLKGFKLTTIFKGSNSGRHFYDTSANFATWANGTADGRWHHFALVGDVKSNKLYAYVDGSWVADLGVAYPSVTVGEDGKAKYWFEGVRVNIAPGNTIGAGNSLNLDNIGIRIFAEDDSLKAALAAKDLTKWGDKNAANPTGSLPVLAKIGETAYTTVSALNAAIAASDTVATVDMQRPFKGVLTVSDTVNFNTNGVCEESVLVAAGGVNKTVDGNTVKFYKMSMAVEGTGNPYTITKYNATDNILSSFGFNNEGHPNKFPGREEAKNSYVTNNLTGDTYLRWDPIVEDPTNVFANLNSNNVIITYKTGVSQYMVYDFDFAYLSGGSSFNTSSVCQTESGDALWGSNGGNKLGAISVTWAPGTFHHVTVVLDYQTNKMYGYIDNVLAYTVDNGIMSPAGFGTWKGANGNKVKQVALRLGQNQDQTVAIDNTCVRHIKNDESLANAITAKDLSGWTDAILNESYVMPQCAPVASVDGEYVYSAEQLAEKVSVYGIHQVEILCAIPEEVTITGDAVVETNGLETTLVAGTGVNRTVSGSVITFDAPFKPSSTSTAPIPGGPSSDMLAAAAVSGIATIRHANLYTPRVNITVVTDATTGNKYIDFRSVSGPADTAHSFVEIETAPHAYTEDTFTVIDFDVAFEYDLIGEMYVQFNSRTPSASNRTAKSNVSEWGLERGKWAHVTIVCDINNNVMYYYVNNKLATGVRNSIYTGSIVDGKAVSGGAQISFHSMRICLNESNKLNTNQNISFDNFSIRHGVSDQWLLDNPGAESIEAWEGRTMNGEYKLPNVPTIAVIDGVEYKTVDKANEALATGENHTVSLDRDFPGALKVASTATVTTNGHTNSVVPAPGYRTVDNGNGIISFEKYEGVGTITVTINGTEVINVKLPYGTDFAAYMSEHHFNRLGYIAVGGKVYTGATWDKEPGIVNADKTEYKVTVGDNVFTGDFVVIVKDNNQYVTKDYADLGAALAGAIDKIIILNKDIELPISTTIRKNTTVYMLGHTISFESGGDHHLTMDSSANPTFIGGSLVDDSAITTYSMFFANYGFSGKIKLVNCQVYGISHIATMRGGTFTAENSMITVPMYQDTYPFEVADYYNGHTRTKVTLNLIDCKIKYTAINSSVTSALINAKDIDVYYNNKASATEKKNMDTDGSKDLINEVNISGCTISIPNQASLLNVAECTDEKANVKFNIDNTVLFVKTLHTTNKDLKPNTYGTVTIGEGVKSAVALTGVTLATGVEEVKNGDAKTPYAYTANYATVKWSNGTKELWADGSVPVNDNCSNDSVRPVVAGETVTFEKSDFTPALKGNMTLNANLIFNLYVPKENKQHITKVTIGGVTYVIDDITDFVKVDGADHYVFEYVMSPEVAAQTFTIVVENASGKIVSKNMSIAQYASRAEEVVPGSADLVKSLLAYVAEAHKYTSNYVNGFDAVEGYENPKAVDIPTTGTDTMTNLSKYIASAQLNLNYGPKWRFNVKGGANISDLTVSVGDKVVEYTIGDGYIEVELPAYEMGKVITITVGEVSGQYDLAAYCAAQAELAASITLTGNRLMGESINAARALESLNLIKAFYTYVYYASAYKA